MKYLRDYYVPCVVKSREYLIGYLDCLQSLSGVLSFDPWIFESCRFNEVYQMMKREVKNLMKKLLKFN